MRRWLLPLLVIGVGLAAGPRPDPWMVVSGPSSGVRALGAQAVDCDDPRALRAVLETPGPVMLLNPEFGGSSAADDHAALGDALAKAGRAVTQVELEGLGFYLQPAVAQELGLEYPLPVGPDPLVAESIVDFIADLEAR